MTYRATTYSPLSTQNHITSRPQIPDPRFPASTENHTARVSRECQSRCRAPFEAKWLKMVLTVHLQPQCQVLNRRVLYHRVVYHWRLALHGLAPRADARFAADLRSGGYPAAPCRARADCRADGSPARSTRTCRACDATGREGAQADTCADGVFGVRRHWRGISELSW